MGEAIRTLRDIAEGRPLKVRAREFEIRQQFAGLQKHVQSLESAVLKAREAYASNLTPESFGSFMNATIRARESRQIFSENASIQQARVEEIVETKQVRETLKQAFRVTQKAILALAADHEADDMTRCIQAGIAFTTSASATELRRKAARIEDVLVHLGNVDQPCWRHGSVLRSL